MTQRTGKRKLDGHGNNKGNRPNKTCIRNKR